MTCRACGASVIPLPAVRLEFLGFTEQPSWLDCICIDCAEQVSLKVPQDADGYPVRPAEIQDLNRYLAERLALMSRRVGQGKSILRCEALTNGKYIGDPHHLRCSRFASRRWQNRDLCGQCHVGVKNGHITAFCEERDRPLRWIMGHDGSAWFNVESCRENPLTAEEWAQFDREIAAFIPGRIN